MKIVDIAAQHIGSGTMVSSAQLCLDDARSLAAAGRRNDAAVRALRSLAYSVGILSPVYRAAQQLGAS